MRNSRIYIYTLIFVMFSLPFLGSPRAFNDDMNIFNLPPRDSVLSVQVDTVKPKQDTAAVDSAAMKKSALQAEVEYVANDSLVMTSDKWAYLYGEGDIKYTNLELKAEHISMSMDSSIVEATFGVDSIGDEFGHPVLSEGGTDYESKYMRYNFKSRKAYIRDVVTQQGEGWVIGKQAKKMPDNEIFLKDGCYTTCDHHDHPHFYLALTKAKVRPKKNIVTGPAYLVIEDLPIKFIGLPFGFFPFTDKYSSGVIMPSPGDDMERGFNLRNGGYYFAINNYVDLALTGEIYTNGSWGLNARSTYRKMYKYSGGFDAGYLVTKRGDYGLDDYNVSKDFRITWNHSQDQKANMFRTISANVNFSTSSYNRNQIDALYQQNLYAQNNKSSSVSLNQRFPNSPFSITASMNIDQRSRDSAISMTLPNMTISMSRLAPFKRKDAVGPERWYEKIFISYTGQLTNKIDTKESKFFKSSLARDWQNGMKHTIPISATFNVLNYINVTPSVNYNERWYTKRVNREWDERQRQFINKDTTSGFYRLYEFSTSLSAQTKLYGFYKPLFVKGTQIRHIFTPTISLNYTPDFSNPMFGYYEKKYYYDRDGSVREDVQSPYSIGMFGVPNKGKNGNVSFGFENNVEMKYATADTVRKISLIDNLGINFQYNMMADSFQWSNINASVRFKLSKSLTVNLTGEFDPYMYNEHGRKLDKLRIQNGKGFGRLIRTGYSISPSINQDTFKKWFGKGTDKENKKKDRSADPESDNPYLNPNDDEEVLDETLSGAPRKSMFAAKRDDGEFDSDGYTRNEVKWSLSASYGFNYATSYNRDDFDVEKREFKRRVSHNFSFNGNVSPTKNWNLSFNSSYDFDAKAITYMSCNVTRNLHCWSLTGSFSPIGGGSYFVTLRANSSMLQDLKYEQRGRRNSYDPHWD